MTTRCALLCLLLSLVGCKGSGGSAEDPPAPVYPAATLVGKDDQRIEVSGLKVLAGENHLPQPTVGDTVFFYFQETPSGELNDRVTYRLVDMESLEFLPHDRPGGAWSYPVKLTLRSGKVLELWAAKLMGFEGMTVPERTKLFRKVASIKRIEFTASPR